MYVCKHTRFNPKQLCLKITLLSEGNASCRGASHYKPQAKNKMRNKKLFAILSEFVDKKVTCHTALASTTTATVSGSAFRLQFSEFCVQKTRITILWPLLRLFLSAPYSRVGAQSSKFKKRILF